MTLLQLLLAATFVLWAGASSAAVFAVTTTTDAVDAVPGDGSCRTSAGGCTLRAAIQEANALPGADDIQLPAGTYLLTIPRQFVADDTAARDDLDITSDLTIAGAAAATTIVEACAVDQKSAPCPAGQGIADRVFHVSGGAVVSFSDLTITNGRHLETTAGSGGGILANDATLTLTNTIVTNNIAGARGGGIFVIGSMTMQSSIVSRNVAANSDGGGIVAAGAVVLVDSVVSDNFAALGGGISQPGGTLTLNRTTVRANIASMFGGGGIQSGGTPPSIVNSTISGNLAVEGLGGGIYVVNGVELTNSTVSGNRSQDCGAINLSVNAASFNNATITDNTATRNTGGVCGGTAFTFTVKNTIIAGNRSLDAGAQPAECSVSATSLGFNLIGDGTGCNGFVNGVNGDLVGTSSAPIDPRLGPLTGNGGLTHTHALVSGSPALDAGNPTACTGADNQPLALDQRGVPRSLDGNGDGASRCDIGALESVGSLSTFTVSRSRPGSGGNAGSVAALVYGAGFVSGMSVKLSRAGHTDINGQTVSVYENGLVAATTFNLAGRPAGLWDLVVTRPDGTRASAAGAFAIESGGAPVLWAEIIGRVNPVAQRPAKYVVLFGNRGSVDAFAVPLGISAPTRAWRPNFAVTPPPAHAGQVATNWSQFPLLAPAGHQQELDSILLLLPIVPAGFTGVLEFTLVGQQRGPFEMTFGVGAPYLQAALNPRVVNAFVEGARAYALRNLGTDVSTRAPAMQAYMTDQLHSVVGQGSAALLTTIGSLPPVYSVPHLMIDLARFAAVQPE